MTALSLAAALELSGACLAAAAAVLQAACRGPVLTLAAGGGFIAGDVLELTTLTRLETRRVRSADAYRVELLPLIGGFR